MKGCNVLRLTGYSISPKARGQLALPSLRAESEVQLWVGTAGLHSALFSRLGRQQPYRPGGNVRPVSSTLSPPQPRRGASILGSVRTNSSGSRRDAHGPPPLEFFATCAPGLEAPVAAELAAPCIGAENIRAGRSGVAFAGTLETGYRANLWLRCAVRVLVRLASRSLSPRANGGDALYAFVREAVAWEELLDPRPRGAARGAAAAARAATFSVDSRVWDCTELTNAHFVSVRAKDAICDALRDACGGRKPEPPGAEAGPDLPLHLSVYRDEAVLYRDMSGQSLHKRGYRDVMHRASLNEGVAAGILTFAGLHPSASLAGEAAPPPSPDERSWAAPGGAAAAGAAPRRRAAAEGRRPLKLLDPMCGSGTLLIEAALMLMNRAPGLLRAQWPFERWHDFDARLWSRAVTEARAAARPGLPDGVAPLMGCEIHAGALSLCERNAARAGVLDCLRLSRSDCREYRPPQKPNLVVVNPPWGARLGVTSGEEAEWLRDTWQALGQFVKRECAESDVYVLSGNESVTRELRMRAARKWPVTVGGIGCRVLQYAVLPPLIPNTLNAELEAAQRVYLRHGACQPSSKAAETC